MEPIDPNEAAKALKHELSPPARARFTINKRTPAPPAPVTEGEKGMGIAALVLGAIVMFASIPGWFMFHEYSGVAIIPGAFIGLFFGIFGRRSACGVAGIALNSIIVTAVLGLIGVAYYQHAQEVSARLQAEKDDRRRQSNEAIRINAERAKNEATAEIAKAQADKARAEADIIRMQEQQRLEKISADQRRAADSDEKARRAREAQERERAEERRVEIDKKSEEAARRFEEQREQQRKADNRRTEDQNHEDAAELKKNTARLAARRADIEETIRLQTKALVVNQMVIDGAEKERKDLETRASAIRNSGQEFSNDEFNRLSAEIQRRKEGAVAKHEAAARALAFAEEQLKQLGDARPIYSEPETSPSTTGVKIVATLKLKSGERIEATSFVETETDYIVKDKDKHVRTVAKTDVESAVKN